MDTLGIGPHSTTQCDFPQFQKVLKQIYTMESMQYTELNLLDGSSLDYVDNNPSDESLDTSL